MPRAKKYNLRHIEDPDNRNGIEFEKLRFEYAWRHFDMHARQRVQMFNFFLISTAFLSGALANVGSGQRPDVAHLSSVIPIFGFAISLIFLLLYFRNRNLSAISCRHLLALEKSVLYPEGFREIFENPETQTGRVTGIMIEDAIGRSWFLRHKFLLPLCHVGGAFLFLFLFLRVNRLI